jgi:hypothetical protein
LGFTDTKYKRSPHSRHDSPSFAPKVLQQCKSRHEILRELSRLPTVIPTFDGRRRGNPAREQAQNTHLERSLMVSIVLRDAV